MTPNAKPRMDVVRREDKETRLKAFILNKLASPATAQADRSWCVIARSMESPVILVLSALSAELQSAGVTIKLLFTQTPPAASGSAIDPVACLAEEVRYTRDIRLLDAHEQLRLDATTCWIGDCMRREPAKRDAYECYANDCADTSNWSAKAFERLWAFGQPVFVTVAAPALEERATPAADEFPMPAAEVPATVVASTRH
jgi:hypothetical protein